MASASKIVLTVEGGLTEQEISDLRYLLTDALSEFAARRTPAKEYIKARYPAETIDYTYDGKLAQVERRALLATKLHDAALSFRCEEVE